MIDTIAGKIAEYGERIEQAIRSIGSSGGDTGVARKDVNFYDYDGTLLYSYTTDEFLALSGMPDLPTHEGLTAENWSYDFQGAGSIAENMGSLNIGAVYSTPATTIKIVIPDNQQAIRQISLLFVQSEAECVEVDWGDGSTPERFALDGDPNHTYAAAGEYTITLTPDEGTTMELSDDAGDYNIFNNSTWAHNPYYSNYYVKEIVVGSRTTKVNGHAFYGFSMMETIVLCEGVTLVGDLAFYNCFKLKALIVPYSATTISADAITNCISLNPYISTLSM